MEMVMVMVMVVHQNCMFVFILPDTKPPSFQRDAIGGNVPGFEVTAVFDIPSSMEQSPRIAVLFIR